MTFLVTGGSGFIGRRIVMQLAARGERVAVFDRDGPPEAIVTSDDLRWTLGDVADQDALMAAVERHAPRFLIHTAFAMDRADYRPRTPTDSPLTRGGVEMVAEQDLGLALRVNCDGMLHVLEAARRCSIERVVYTSAVAAFGSAIDALHRDPIGDEGVFAPDSMYGATKVLNEVMARLYRDRFDVDSIGLRIARTFGTGNPAPFTDFLRRVAIEEAVDLVEPGYFNSYLYVDDCADAHIFACTAPRPSSPVLNVREGEYSNADLAAAIARVHPTARVRLVDGRDGGVRVPRLLTPGMDELGWRAPHDLDRALIAAMNPWRIEAGLPPLAEPAAGQTGLPAFNHPA